MFPEISEELLQEYEENGAVCLKNVFDDRWVDTVRRGIAQNLANPSQFAESLASDKGQGAYFNDYCNWLKIREFEEYVFHSPAARLAAAFMRSGYAAFYHEHVLVKEPGTLKETPWHHDQSYYPIDGDKVCSIWMPVDPVPEDTCVQFVAGSHKAGWYLPRKFATGLPYPRQGGGLEDCGRRYLPVPAITDQHRILKWSLQPGDCILFHMRTLHGAPANISMDRWRRVLSTRWLGDDAVVATRPWNTSPPSLGGLKPGDRAVSSQFPKVWPQ